MSPYGGYKPVRADDDDDNDPNDDGDSHVGEATETTPALTEREREEHDAWNEDEDNSDGSKSGTQKDPPAYTSRPPSPSSGVHEPDAVKTSSGGGHSKTLLGPSSYFLSDPNDAKKGRNVPNRGSIKFPQPPMHCDDGHTNQPESSAAGSASSAPAPLGPNTSNIQYQSRRHFVARGPSGEVRVFEATEFEMGDERGGTQNQECDGFNSCLPFSCFGR